MDSVSQRTVVEYITSTRLNTIPGPGVVRLYSFYFFRFTVELFNECKEALVGSQTTILRLLYAAEQGDCPKPPD